MAVLVQADWLAFPIGISQHSDEHCPERPILLAVDQELGEGTALRVAPELADPLGARTSRHAGECEFASATDAAALGSS
jgi:hypothetical protein